MATIYSLICFGGRVGKTATMTIASPCVASLTKHGLRDGTGVVFSTTGALPTGVSSGTTYYVKSTGTDTFNLYDTAAHAIAGGSTGRVNTSGSQSGTHTIKGAYFLSLTSGQLARYGNSGSERIYAGLSEWNTARASASATDIEVCEIGEAWTDNLTAYLEITVPAAQKIIEAKVNGEWSAAFHGGVFGAGYILNQPSNSNDACNLVSDYTSFDGFTIQVGSGWYSSVVLRVSGFGSAAKNLIVLGPGGYSAAGSYGICIGQFNSGQTIENCIVAGGVRGFYITQYMSGLLVANNIATKCVTGFSPSASTAVYGRFYNNISVGNTTNWGTASGFSDAHCNAGLSGEAWTSASRTRLTIATTDFSSYPANLSPAAVTSPQVETGTEYFNAISYDIAGNYRAAYSGSNYNTAVSAGSFVAGLSYTIVAVGTTDFTLIGASANTVGVTFKATGVGSGTGTATLNAKYDVGPYEFDLGYGDWPASQFTTINGVTLGRIKIAKQSDGSEIYNDTTLPSDFATAFTTATPVYVYIRNGSAAPYYHPLKLAATIDVDVGLDYDATGLQQEDIAAHDYTGTAVASDWSFNLSTGAITHDSGTTRYSVQDLYSWHQDYTDGSTQIDDDPLMHGTTPHIFELINSGDISDSDLQDLYGGSIEFVDGTLWSNIYQAGTLAGTPPIYLVQNGSKVSSFWDDGSLDVLIKVANAGTLIDSGLVDAYVRTYGYTYAYYQVDASAGGSNVAPLATLNYAVTQTIDESTAATYSDVGYTFGSTSQDLGEGGGAATYYCRIDCAGRTLDQVAARTQYDCRDDSTTTLNSLEGWRYRKAHSSYAANDAAPFGVYSGGVWQVAQGVWLDNVATADQYNYILTDHAGTTHQLVASANQTVTVNGLAAGYRLQIYDTTSTTELYNDIVSGSSYTWTDSSSAVASRAIRVRIAYCTSTTAIQFVEAAIGTCGTTPTTKDVTYLAAIANDQVYIDNAVDGSAVTGVTFTDSTVDKMNIDISAGVDLQDLYAAWVYYAFTAIGIATDIDYINAIDAANYVYSNLQWKNVTSPSAPLKISGGYAWDSATGDPMDLIDTTGGTIFLAPPHVVAKTITVSGSDVITGDISTVLAAIPSASTNASATRTNLATELATIVRTEKWVRNKRTLDPATGMQRIYDDDGATVLGEGEAWLDADGAQPYDGSGAVHRTERLA